MKIKSLLSLAMAALLATACSNEEELAYTATNGVLKATVEGNNADTRVGFGQKGDFYWSTGDKLGVTTSDSQGKFYEFTLMDGNSGQATGTFTGTHTGVIEGYAVYPYSKNHSISENTLTYNFPASYTYTKVDADYFTETAGTGNSFNTAMWGKIKNNSVGLKHLGGVFCIKITKMPVAEGTLTFTTNKKITGDFTADLAATQDNQPALSAGEAAAAEGNSVTISFTNATANQPGVFYVPVPTGTYTATVKIENGGNEKLNLTALREFTINRRTAQKLIVGEGSITATEGESVDQLSEAGNSLVNNDNVLVTGEVTGNNNTVTIGENITGTKTLALENVADNAQLTIDGSAANQLENFTLSIPNTTSTGDALLDVTVNMPSTSVTLAGNAGEAKYGNVTTTTAANTLIIGSKISVAKVIVKKGNIRVNAGATLTAIEKDAENKNKVIIYKEANANIPSNLGAGFEVRDAAVADMKKVFAEGGTYVLPQDLNIVGMTMEVPAGKQVTLDLNGKKLEAANDANIQVNGSFTLQDNVGNGTIEAMKDWGKPYTTGVINIVGENAKMTMQGGYIKAVRADAVNKGQFGIVVDKGGDFTMTGGKIEAGWYAVSGNGTNQSQNSIIDIKGGELTSTADYTIYLPHAGTTHITGGTIKGGSGAIGMRSGTLNIGGDATLIAEGTGDTGQWSDGTATMGYAVVNIGNGNQNTYGNCTVNINGGTFLAQGNSVDIAKRETGAKHTITVNVNGGTFSDLSAANFIAENAKIDIVLNKDVEIKKAVNLTKAGAVTNINLNDKKILNQTEINNNGWETEAFVITKGTLNIEGNGTIECTTQSTNDGYREVISAYGNSVVNLKGGYYKNYQATNGQYDLIYAKDNATINISGGTYESGGYSETVGQQHWVLNINDSNRNTAKINVTGGTFKNFNPANNRSEGENTNFVAEGYEVTCNGAVTTEVYTKGDNKDYVVRKKAQ